VLVYENTLQGCWCHVLGQRLLAFMKVTNNYFAVSCFYSNGDVYISIDPGENAVKEKDLSVL